MKLIERLSTHGLVIFLFHGVVEKSNYSVRNYTKKHVEKEYFLEFIRRLKDAAYLLSMDEVVGYHKEDKPFPPRACAVTFDDGFENNYSVAVPILKQCGVPATFYITTDFVQNNYMSWIDRIEYCLELVPEGQLVFPWDQTAHPFRDREDKIGLLDDMRRRVKRDASVDLEGLVSSIFSQCRMQETRQSNDPLDLKMNWDQVRELNNDENFLIGGHSCQHLNLTFLNEVELENEIKTSIEIMEKETGITVKHYCYPEGLSYSYSQKVIEVLMKNGIVCCPTAEDGINNVTTNLFHLKRVSVT